MSRRTLAEAAIGAVLSAALTALALASSGCSIHTKFEASASLFRHDDTHREADVYAQAVRLLKSGKTAAEAAAVLEKDGVSKDEAERIVALAQADLPCCVAKAPGDGVDAKVN